MAYIAMVYTSYGLYSYGTRVAACAKRKIELYLSKQKRKIELYLSKQKRKIELYLSPRRGNNAGQHSLGSKLTGRRPNAGAQQRQPPFGQCRPPTTTTTDGAGVIHGGRTARPSKGCDQHRRCDF